MYSTCLHCHHALGTNEAIEQFPVGRRLAFDSAKGRLWVICQHCARWNLTPIEERWEAVEECERQFRAAKARAQTTNIGLARTPDGTDLIRIGSPLRPELASWRYGGVFRRRMHKRVAFLAGVGGAAGAGALLVAGAPILATIAPLAMLPLGHFIVAGFLFRGEIGSTRVVGDDGKAFRVTRSNLEHTRLVVDDDTIGLHLRHSYGRQELTGDRAVRALSTLMVFANRSGGSNATIASAAQMITEAGDPRRTIANVAQFAKAQTGNFEERFAESVRAPRGRTMGEALRAQMQIQKRSGNQWSNMPPSNRGALHHLPRVHRLALEIALHESYEELALNDELASLQRAWREAEEIAAIADDLLVPATVRSKLKDQKKP